MRQLVAMPAINGAKRPCYCDTRLFAEYLRTRHWRGVMAIAVSSITNSAVIRGLHVALDAGISRAKVKIGMVNIAYNLNGA